MGKLHSEPARMKLLLDENLPLGLRHEIPGHNCETVAHRGWLGIGNGQLLALAAQAGFEALLTKDTKLQYQQNLTNLPVAVVMLRCPSTICGRLGSLCRICSLHWKTCRQIR